MSAKPETTFINGVHKHLNPGRVDPYYVKMHNEYAGGIWDCWYSGKARDLWIEYKFITIPKRPTTIIFPELSELQVQWGAQRYAEGRNLAVIIGCKEGGVILEDLEWENGIAASAFKVQVRSRKEIAEWIVSRTQK